MPQMIPVELNDGTNGHTFNPRGIDANGVATLVESTGVPIGDRRVTVKRSRTSAGREKVTFNMTIPVVQNATVDGISRPTVVRTAYADLTFSFDGSSSIDERNDVRMMLADLVGNEQPLAAALVDNLEALF